MKSQKQNKSEGINVPTQFAENFLVIESLFSPLGGLLVISVLALVIILFSGGGVTKSNKHKIGRARWGLRRERRAAARVANKQIRKRERNKLALYVSKEVVPPPVRIGERNVVHIPNSSKKLYLPFANSNFWISGETGIGKSYSFINRLIYSFLDQGFPGILYDFKYNEAESQTAKIAGYALERGYEVFVFAPTFPESMVLNPLDFLRDFQDGDMARELALVLQSNFALVEGKGGSDNSNQFFKDAGLALLIALILLTKFSSKKDLATTFRFSALRDLAKRIETANLPLSLKDAFAQFLKSSGSGETASSIEATALNLLAKISTPEILACICGSSTLPIDLTGKKLVILGLDVKKQKTLTPLIATVLHLILTHNLGQPRKEPLVVCLDELPTINLPKLKDWLNQKRENGFCAIIGVQNYTQLKDFYGASSAETIFTGCATKAFFKAGSDETAKKYSEYLGQEEISNPRREKSGEKGRLRTSYRIQSRPLFDVSQFNTLPRGQAVVINPGFASPNQSSLPILEDLTMPPVIKELEKRSMQVWHKYKQELIRNSKTQVLTDEEQLERKAEVESILPLPDNDNAENSFMDKFKNAFGYSEEE